MSGGRDPVEGNFGESERIDEDDVPGEGPPLRVIGRSYAEESFLRDRSLPYSEHAEIGLLAAILRSNAALDNYVVARLKPEEFQREAHQHIFNAMRALHVRGDTIDFVTLAHQLERFGWLDQSGGESYLRLILEYPQGDAVAEYANIIRDKARLRALIDVLDESLRECYEAKQTAVQMYGKLMRKIYDSVEAFVECKE